MTYRALRSISAGSAIAATLACNVAGFTFSPSPLSSVSLAPESPFVQLRDTVTMVAIPMDAEGISISGKYPARFSSSDTTRVTVGPITGIATGVAVGNATITATVGSRARAYSAVQVVSVIVLASPTDVIASAALEFEPSEVTISAGNALRWQFESVTHSVTFDYHQPRVGETAPVDIGPTSNAVVERTFSTHGTYSYHCSIHPWMTGIVTVN
jgi:plastocyanin